MKKRHREFIRKLRAAGAVVGIREDAPDYITEAFIRGIMECSDCSAAIANVEKREAADRRGARHEN